MGAGPAGILAGVTAREIGLDVLVLEARDRLGGRANSKRLSDGTAIERGATLVNGPAIATWEFIARLGLKTHCIGAGRRRAPAPIFSDGAWGGEPDPEAVRGTDRARAILGRRNPDGLSARDVLVAGGLSGRALEAAERTLCVPAPMAPELVSARSASEVKHIGDSIEDPVSGINRPGNPNFILVEGYDALWDAMSRPMSDNIRLSTPATAVEWSSDGVVVDAGGQTFEGRTAIVTLPLGVLQAGSVEFRPALSGPKQAAIDGLVAGPLAKVVAEFRRPWWEDTLGRVSGFATSSAAVFSRYQVHFWDLPGPPTLTSLAGWPDILEVTGDDNRVGNAFLGPLGEMFPGVDIEAEIVSVDVADWASDPYAMTGVSVVPVGKYQLRADLAAPTPPLYWAGEATHTRGHAVAVHGALETGRRAAMEVLHSQRQAFVGQPDSRIDWWQYTDRMSSAGN